MAPRARELEDADEIQYLEYWCKLTFRSTDLHVRTAWSFYDASDLENLRVYAEKLEGPIVYSFIDVEDITGEEASGKDWHDLVDAGYLDVDWRDVEFPVGSLEFPRALRRGEAKAFLVCKVALGRASTVKDGEVPKFPEFFSSCLVRSQASALVAKARGADSLDAVADWQQVYRVRKRDQVLPYALCEVVFEEQRAAAKPLICEYCEQRPAAVYCKNDNAHFCAACDTTHHSENEFFARHQRFSLEHSPLQFGFCRQHPSERHESVCLQCKTMLCRICNKFGDHARKEHEGHTLMSTVEAFQLAMQQSTDSDSQQEKHQTLLRDALQDRHFQMMEVHNNFQETQHQMDVVLRGALDQLERAQSRKLEFLQSMKRQVTTQLLFIQWLDNFQSHARMALPPADFVVATKRHEGLLAALFGSNQGAVPKGAELGLGPIPDWVQEELLLEGAVSVQLTSLPPPIPEPGPPVPKPAVELPKSALTNGQADQEPGTSYLEATPRGRPADAPHAPQRPAAPAGIAGASDTLYVQKREAEAIPSAATAASTALAASSASLLDAAASGLLDAAAVSAVEQVPSQNARAEFDGYISQAFAYLDEAQKRIDARANALPSIAASAVPPRVPSLQLATEVLVQLRQSAEQVGGPAKPWGALLMLLGSCPGGERQELLLKALRVAAPIGDTAGQLAKSVVEDDVQRTQVPSLLVSANGLHTALVSALLRLSGSSFMEKEITMLIREVEVSSDTSMHQSVENFIRNMVHALRSGQGHVHPSLSSVCHLVYSAAEVKFGILAAQNAVATLLLSRVITPSLLRARPTEPAAGGAAAPFSERVSELSRLLQRIAHFAHHDDDARSHAGVPDLSEVLKHVAALRELVSRVLALPPDPQMGLNSATEDSEAAALWIVQTCRRWMAQVPAEDAGSRRADGRARQQQQLELIAGPLARLGEPSHSFHAMPEAPRPLADRH
ncbi:unnamed protein product [Durusdinium trenchii]|uniref:E3 ubiquitin-protein ligase TRIM9 (RING finger protein 91) (RING-type E3 ubiquitin transferase TRIM9) (Tripartite motif-containing protein 9) n=2 Tax=Durusdinium trenchii TaxID=1381693 RepID=A0ABP0JFI5_9DINO